MLKGVIAKVEERFRLDLNDEQAERFFIGLINDCLAAIAPRVMDVFHSIAVARNQNFPIQFTRHRLRYGIAILVLVINFLTVSCSTTGSMSSSLSFYEN